MLTNSHKTHAGPGAPIAAPVIASRYASRKKGAQLLSFALPKDWSFDRGAILILPAAIALVGLLAGILCWFIRWP